MSAAVSAGTVCKIITPLEWGCSATFGHPHSAMATPHVGLPGCTGGPESGLDPTEESAFSGAFLNQVAPKRVLLRGHPIPLRSGERLGDYVLHRGTRLFNYKGVSLRGGAGIIGRLRIVLDAQLRLLCCVIACSLAGQPERHVDAG